MLAAELVVVAVYCPYQEHKTAIISFQFLYHHHSPGMFSKVGHTCEKEAKVIYTFLQWKGESEYNPLSKEVLSVQSGISWTGRPK
jgi:hypothetical protein